MNDDDDVEIKEISIQDNINNNEMKRIIKGVSNLGGDDNKHESKAIILDNNTGAKESGIELIELNNMWQSLNPTFSQTKPLPFSQGQRQQDFWNSQIANEAQDLFKALMPKKIVLAVCHQLNTQLRKMFSGQMDEKNLKKKLYKPEQLYEYFGIKIFMGYCRMPDPEDYFNQNLPFRNRIGDLIKEGRFKCVESWTQFNDDMLDSLKHQRQQKTEYKEPNQLEGLMIPRIMKKFNKIQQRACSSQQNLIVTRNQYFESADQGDSITCLQLQDGATNFILQSNFLKRKTELENITIKMLEHYKQRNHKVYLQRHLLQIEHINHLSICNGLYCSGIVKNPSNTHEIKFSKGELVSNGTLMVLQLKQKDASNIMISAADGFHRYSATDKRSFATVTLQELLKKAEQPSILNDQYKCQFSCISQSGALFTEVVEMITWNSYVAYKHILKKNTAIEYLDFRLLLAKQLLASKIKPIEAAPQPQLPLPHVKTSSIGIQTEKLSSFSSFQPKAPISSFHIPTILVVSPNFAVSLVCLVCRRPHTQLTQCANCSEVSGKLVSLCPTECFSLFHQQPTEYISQADDLPSLPPASQKLAHQAQFDQSTLAQSASYQQSALMKYNTSSLPNNPNLSRFPPLPPLQGNKQQKQQQMSMANQMMAQQQNEYYDLDGQNFEQMQVQQQLPDLVDDEDLWDDEQLRRRPGRPKGAKNRAQRLMAPEDNRGPSHPKPIMSQSYYDFDDDRQQNLAQKSAKKQVSYSFVGPQDQ